MAQTYIEDIAAHEGQTVTLKGWLHNRRSSGKIHFLIVRDGTGHRPGRDVEGRRRRRDVPARPTISARRSPSSSPARCAPTRARPAATSSTSSASRWSRAALDYPITPKEHGVDFLLDRRHLWIRVAAAAGHPARAPRGDQRRPRLLQRPRLHPRRHADLHAGGVRRHDDAVPGPVLRGHDGLPHAERPALQRGQRDGARDASTASARRSAPRSRRRAAT